MVLVCIERINRICPSLVESFDCCKVIFLSYSQDQIVVFDSPTISEHNFIFLGIDFVNSHII